jgi:hypothetical protein
MKNLLKIVSIIGLTVIIQTAYLAAVTDTFTTGDTLTTAQLNNIKSAVNDNDTRISEIELTRGPAGADSTVAGPKGDTGADSTVAGPKGDTGADSTVAGPKGDTGADSTVAGPPGTVGLGAVVFNSAPTVDDDMNTYTLDTVWIDTLGASAYILVDNSPSAAVWTVLGGSATGSLYAIGDAGPAGGIVFHVTDGGLHGLEAAPVDQVSTHWGCDGTQISGANRTVVGTGEQNTADIIAGCNETTAASVASAYGPGWFLPSKDELNLLYTQKEAGVVGGFASYYYWSSSQYYGYSAWYQFFGYGNQYANNKNYALRVRAVRAF